MLVLLAMVFILTGCESEKDKNQDAYRQYGINCMENGNYEEAVDAFQKALDQSAGTVGEKEVDICFYKAEAQYLSGDTDGALATYDALIKYNQTAEAYYLRGSLYFMLGQSEDALNDYATAVSKDKNDYELYIGIYESMAAYGMASEGQYYLNEALNIKGDKAYDNMQKGRIYFLLGDSQNAVSLLTKAVEDGSDEANYYLAEVYAAIGDSEKSDACFAAYLDSGIADSVDLCEMGERQMANGDYEHALTYFTAALDMEEVPNKQVLMKDIVVVYENTGDFASAKEMLESYLELYPSDEEAEKELVFLETR